MVVVSQKNEFLSLICPSLLVSTPGSWSRYQGWRHIWGSQSPAPPALSGGGSPAGPDPGPPSSLRASMSQNLVILLSPNAVRKIFMASFNLNRWYLPMEPEPFKEMLWIIRLSNNNDPHSFWVWPEHCRPSCETDQGTSVNMFKYWPHHISAAELRSVWPLTSALMCCVLASGQHMWNDMKSILLIVKPKS